MIGSVGGFMETIQLLRAVNLPGALPARVPELTANFKSLKAVQQDLVKKAM